MCILVLHDGMCVVKVISNPRATFHAPTGQGFRPAETAAHHRQNVVSLVIHALREAHIKVTVVFGLCLDGLSTRYYYC